MGKRGRATQPDEIKKMKGETRPCRTNPDKPKYRSIDDLPPPPDDMSKRAKEEWKERTRDLQGIGMLSAPDLVTLRIWCESVDMKERMLDQCYKEGFITTTEKGYKRKNPAWQVYQDCIKNIIQVSGRFGFTPSDRSNIQAPPKKEDIGESLIK